MKKWLLLTLLVCACLGQKSQFTVTDMTFCTSEPSDRAYDRQPDSVYSPGDIVWMYLEVFKFDYTETDSGYTAVFTVSLQVYNTQGGSVRSGTHPMETSFKGEPVYTWFKFWIDSTDLPPGVYTVELTITDTLSGDSAVTEGVFTID
ncbi:MAG: hypothetical protein PVF58_18975 [Candidatus Methanofastidiosia archaeon]|jgi:hypothetical protein